MRKTFMLAATALLVASQSFASYIVVLKDGTKYTAKAKWTIVNGKAIVKLENGSTMQLDPALIDAAKSEQVTKLGLGDVNIIGQEQAAAPQQATPAPSLGSQIKLRNPGAPAPAAPAPKPAAPKASTSPAPAAPVTSPGNMDQEVLDKFERAFENVGIFEHKLTSTGARSLRAELVTDSEDKVFHALSATSFLMARNAGVDGAQIDLVELFLKTTTGGSSGRFQVTRADAEMLDKKQMTLQEYFVRKVIF